MNFNSNFDFPNPFTEAPDATFSITQQPASSLTAEEKMTLLHNHILSLNPQITPTEIPAAIIKFASDHYILDHMIYLTRKVFAKKDDIFVTSCTSNAREITKILTGVQQAAAIKKKLLKFCDHIETIHLSRDTDHVWQLEVNDLFSGYIMRCLDKISGLGKLDKTQEVRLCNIYGSRIRKQFQELYEPHYSLITALNMSDDEKIKELKRLFSTVKFNFNEAVINDVIKEMDNNHAHLLKDKSKNKSFLYTFSIAHPFQANHTFYDIDHMFLIEQYYSENGKDTCYNYYSSWIGKSVLQCFPMEKEAVFNCVTKLRGLNHTINPETGKEISLTDCFRYNSSPFINGLGFNPSTGRATMGGLGVRCYTTAFNPQKVMGNFIEIISKDQTLTNLFCRHVGL